MRSHRAKCVVPRMVASCTALISGPRDLWRMRSSIADAANLSAEIPRSRSLGVTEARGNAVTAFL